MRNQILEDLKTAMKNQDKETLSVIRMIKGAIQMEELNTKRELTDDEVIGIVSKQIKTRKEFIAEFEKGNRNDLIEQTESEIKILEKYLPEQLSEDEMLKIIDQAFNEVQPESMKDMGKLMGIITPKVKGRYDMGEISKIIKNKINGN
ncbi:MAG: GatB/YqeY domain-containing protein [Bacilli bacterium]